MDAGIRTQIDLWDMEGRSKRINGDERYLIIQGNEVIHTLHFAYEDGAEKEKGKLLLAPLAQCL